MLDSADVLIWTTESPEEQQALLADPEVAQSQATTQNRHVFTTKDLAGAIAFASTLSYPVVADQLPRKSPRSWADSGVLERLLRQLWQCP